MKKLPKISAIFKELAMLVLKFRSKIPSFETTHAALLLTHVARSRALGHDIIAQLYGQMLGVYLSHKLDFWSELGSREPEVLIGINAIGDTHRTRESLGVVLGIAQIIDAH